MSSTLDHFECPLCRENTAYSEQDAKSGQRTFGCSVCNWDGTQIEEKLEEVRENLETWLEENENNETLFDYYRQHLQDKREIEPKYYVSFERFLKRYYFKAVDN